MARRKKGRKKIFPRDQQESKEKTSKIDSTGEGIFIITNELYSTVKNFH